ncbi:MAG: VWA domain-containing protein [Verrucomicrobiaceae bacterium]|nr:MAG: VWA domain-containing protein [Verrucomicrobiaceae bacterium]
MSFQMDVWSERQQIFSIKSSKITTFMALTIEIPSGATSRKSMPVVLLVDVSTSMDPVGITQANQGIRDYIDELQRSEETRDSVFLSVITFSDVARTLIEHQVIAAVSAPHITAGAGMTNLDKGLAEVLALVKRKDLQFKGGKEPLFVLITDGNPNCPEKDWKAQLEIMNKHPLIGKRPSGRAAGYRVIAGAGEAINDAILTEFRHDPEKSQIVRIKDQTTISSFLKHLKTLTIEISEARPMTRIIGTQVIN